MVHSALFTGFGALGASILLKPVSDSYVELYLASMIMATLMELFTASVMIHLFGSFWWDYSEKPFNYKGDHLPGEQSWLGVFLVLFIMDF